MFISSSSSREASDSEFRINNQRSHTLIHSYLYCHRWFRQLSCMWSCKPNCNCNCSWCGLQYNLQFRIITIVLQICTYIHRLQVILMQCIMHSAGCCSCWRRCSVKLLFVAAAPAGWLGRVGCWIWCLVDGGGRRWADVTSRTCFFDDHISPMRYLFWSRNLRAQQHSPQHSMERGREYEYYGIEL